MAQHSPPQALFVVLKKGKVAYAVMFGMSPKFIQEEHKVIPSFSVKFQDIFTHPSNQSSAADSISGKLNP